MIFWLNYILSNRTLCNIFLHICVRHFQKVFYIHSFKERNIAKLQIDIQGIAFISQLCSIFPVFLDQLEPKELSSSEGQTVQHFVHAQSKSRDPHVSTDRSQYLLQRFLLSL